MVCSCYSDPQKCQFEHHYCLCTRSTHGPPQCRSSKYHICVCSWFPSKCKSEQKYHQCICTSVDPRTFICRSSDHLCICSQHKGVCLSEEHHCVCYWYDTCISDPHECICHIGKFLDCAASDHSHIMATPGSDEHHQECRGRGCRQPTKSATKR